jgi:hypothetical protein
VPRRTASPRSILCACRPPNAPGATSWPSRRTEKGPEKAHEEVDGTAPAAQARPGRATAPQESRNGGPAVSASEDPAGKSRIAGSRPCVL